MSITTELEQSDSPVHPLVLWLDVPDPENVSVRVAPACAVVQDVPVLVPGIVGVVLPRPHDPPIVGAEWTGEFRLPVTELPDKRVTTLITPHTCLLSPPTVVKPGPPSVVPPIVPVVVPVVVPVPPIVPVAVVISIPVIVDVIIVSSSIH